MQGNRPKPLLILAFLFLFMTSLLVSTASAQKGPQVPKEYQKYFLHYVDKRSFLERALNLFRLASKDVGRSLALVAGVSRFPNMPPLETHLKPAAEDLRKLPEYLKTYEFFDEIVVLKDKDVTYENLAFFLQSYFPKRLKKFPKSRFLFAYSGHGMSEGTRGYLLKNTARSLRDKDHSICFKIVRVLFDEVVESGHHVLALINACYSGAFLKRTFGSKHFVPKQSGAHAITAGGSDEPAWHDPEIGSGSIFFEKFFAGLDGRADMFPKREDAVSGDGLITVDELATYLRQEIQIFTDQKQNPQVGDISKHGSLGCFFFLNRERQIAKAIVPEWSPERATPSDIEAQNVLIKGKKYYRAGEYNLALPFFQQAAKVRNPEAMAYLGYMHEKGKGVAKHPPKAAEWYHMGAKYGDADAMESLGRMHYDGRGVPIDYATASHWFHKGAQAGSASAMTSLGSMYLSGMGVKRDDAKAVHWLDTAAKAGASGAMTQLGCMYEKGWGVPKDKDKAVRWYRKAASLGEEDAVIRLEKLGEQPPSPSKEDAVIQELRKQPPSPSKEDAVIQELRKQPPSPSKEDAMVKEKEGGVRP